MFSASDVKTLREKTGAGMLDCKKALEATNGDFNAAVDWLREKGISTANKKASRIAAEGMTDILVEGNNAVIVEVNCETDFVSKGDAFKELVENVASVILKNNPADVAAAKELTKDLFTDATVKMGEKFDLRRFEVLEKVDGQYIATYIHMGGKIGVAVVLDKEDAELGKGLAMHIAANNPQYLSLNDDSSLTSTTCTVHDLTLTEPPSSVTVSVSF